MKGSVINDLQKESEQFYPKYDINFSSIFEKEMLRKMIDADQYDRATIINELKKISEENLNGIFKKIDPKAVNFGKNRIDKIKRGHKVFIQTKFFEIIKTKFKEATNLVYEELSEILETQISEDNTKLSKFFTKNGIKERKNSETFEDASLKSCNYVIKEEERESEREIEVNISDDDFEKTIPQDF